MTKSAVNIPREIRTPRLLLRSWHAADAASLHPVLLANQAHIASWIPRRVSDPASVTELAARLDDFGASFDASREWRYGIFSPDEAQLFGEVDLLPRNADARVPYGRVAELIGRLQQAGLTRIGFVTEAPPAAATAR